MLQVEIGFSVVFGEWKLDFLFVVFGKLNRIDCLQLIYLLCRLGYCL